ncbi:MAG: hypothetical protein Q9218_000502 [Villophora microphyllina]
MEKIKNIIHPGKSKDDEVMYGSGQSGDPVHMGTGSQATGSHDTNDPSHSSTGPTGNTTRDPVGQGGVGSIQQPSHMSGTLSDDAGSATSIKSGLAGNSRESKITGIPETHDALDTNKALPREPTTGGHGAAGATGALTGGSLPDRTAETAGNTTESGRSFPLGGASSGHTTSGPHTSDLANKADPRIDSDHDGSRGLGPTSGYGSGTGATVGSTHQGDLNRAGGGTTFGGTTGESLPRGYGEESWTHDHLKHGHEFAGDPCENEPPVPGAVHFIPGPHSLDTTNRLDPYVSGGGPLESLGSSTTTGDSTSHSGHHHGHHHTGKDAGMGAGLGAGMGTGAYESTRDTPVTSSTQQGTTGGPLSHTGHHHTGRDATMGAGLGAGTYESSRDMPATSSMQEGTATAGPHNSGLLDKADPRVDSDLSRQQGSVSTPGMTDMSGTSMTEPTTGREHHHGRDAALAGAGGAGVAGLYEAEKHRGHNVPESTSTSGYSNPYPPTSSGMDTSSGPSMTGRGTDSAPGIGSGFSDSTTGTTRAHDPTSTGKDHHYGRDAGLVGAGAGAAYEADKHLRGPHGGSTESRAMDAASTQQPLSGTSAPGYGSGTGMTGAGTTGLHESRHEPNAMTGSASQPSSGYDERDRTRDHHLGRDAAIGAGAGAATVAGGEELSQRDLEHERKLAHEQELKDQKAAHKHELKDEKHHQHELEKERKAHEKAMAKEEAKHEKEEAKHHKKDEAPEHEKKHHGLFGFLHRDKPDKELKEEELARKELEESSHHPGVGTTAGTAAGLSEMEKHQLAKEHDRNRLHKDPPPGFGETEYAKAPQKGYASQVTGGTGTTALAQGEPVARGSHLTSMGNTVDPR